MKYHDDYIICETQAKIYEYAVQQGYDLKVFSDAFLTSDFCHRAFDRIYSRYHNELPEECADFFLPEIENKLVKVDENERNPFAWDIGFMYRLLYLETSVSSARLTEIVPFDEMKRMAPTFDHYGFEEKADEIIKKYRLPKSRYDKDFTLLLKDKPTKEERE